MKPERPSLQDLFAAARTQPAFLPKDDAYRSFRQRSLESFSPATAHPFNTRTFILAGGVMAVIVAIVFTYFTAFNQKADNAQITPPERKTSIPAMALVNDSTKAKSTHTPAVNDNASQPEWRHRTDSGSPSTAATSNSTRSEASATAAAIIPALNRVSNSLPVMFANCTPEQIDGYTLFDLDSAELSRLGLTVLTDGAIREILDSDSNIMIWKDRGKGAARYTFPDIVLELHPNPYPSASETSPDSIMTLEMPSFEFGSYLYGTAFNSSPSDSTFKNMGVREFQFRVRGWKPGVTPALSHSPRFPGDGTITLQLPVRLFASALLGTNAAGNSSSPVIVTNSAGRTYAHHTSMGSEATINKEYRIPDFTKNTVENPVASKTIKLESGSYTLQDLVPIRIRTLRPPIEPDSIEYFIVYWYEPSKNVLAKLPERVQKTIQQDREQRLRRIEKSKFNDDLPRPLTLEACVFPNPVTQDRATVHYSLPEAGRVAMALYDITGKRLRDFALCEDRREGNWEDQVSLHGIAPGLYVLAVTTDRGEQAIQKVVVQR